MSTQHPALEAIAARVNTLFGDSVDDLTFADLVDAALVALDSGEVATA